MSSSGTFELSASEPIVSGALPPNARTQSRTNRNSDLVQSTEELMQLQVQQTLEEQIKASFGELHSRIQIAPNKEDRENERADPRREHKD